jgi:hypothetical protein
LEFGNKDFCFIVINLRDNKKNGDLKFTEPTYSSNISGHFIDASEIDLSLIEGFFFVVLVETSP